MTIRKKYACFPPLDFLLSFFWHFVKRLKKEIKFSLGIRLSISVGRNTLCLWLRSQRSRKMHLSLKIKA